MTGYNSKRQMSQDKLNDDDDTQVYAGRKRGSIALARSLCYQINGAADDSDDMDGGGYGSVDIAEILSAEVLRLQKSLAQPEQEPVAWVCYGAPGKRDIDFEEADINGLPIGTSLYTTPPPLEQEPVAWGVFGHNLHDMFFTKEDAQEMVRLKGDGSTVKPLYTTPPQPKPLTDEWIYRTTVLLGFNPEWTTEIGIAHAIVRAAEAEHGIK